MREYLTSEDICNSISMQRTVFDGAVLVVEGVTDNRLYGKFLDRENSTIIVAHSKDNARNVVRTMASERFDDRVIGIIDADLDRLNGKCVKPPMFMSDCRDMEMMVIRSNALNDLLDEYGEREKVEDFEKRMGPIRDVLIQASFPLGLLMFVSKRMGLNLSYKDLNFNAFINPRDLTLDPRAMITEVLHNSKYDSISPKELLATLNTAASNLEDRWDAARGHDTIDILLIGLKKNFGSFNAGKLNEGQLGGALRLAFSDDDFRATRVYADTQAWADEAGIILWKLNDGAESQ